MNKINMEVLRPIERLLVADEALASVMGLMLADHTAVLKSLHMARTHIFEAAGILTLNAEASKKEGSTQ